MTNSNNPNCEVADSNSPKRPNSHGRHATTTPTERTATAQVTYMNGAQDGLFIHSQINENSPFRGPRQTQANAVREKKKRCSSDAFQHECVHTLSRTTSYQVALAFVGNTSTVLFCTMRAIRQTGKGPRPMHSGLLGASETFVCRELTGRVIIGVGRAQAYCCFVRYRNFAEHYITPSEEH